jgi:hypothetical protein
VKVLKTHLPKVINELLCGPTVDDVLDHMHRDLLEIGVAPSHEASRIHSPEYNRHIHLPLSSRSSWER